MKIVGLSLALVALIAVPAFAGWSTSESTSSIPFLYHYDGQFYFGTMTVHDVHQFMDNGQNSFEKGSLSWEFEAFDGSLTASGKSTYKFKGSSNSANNFTLVEHVKVVSDEGVDVTNGIIHLTFNANGELTSFHVE